MTGDGVPVPATERPEAQSPSPLGKDLPAHSRSGAGGGASTRLLIWLVRGWQIGPSAILPPSCRFQPSCSAYAITALRRYGALKGGWLAVKRIARCHPFGSYGPDPVP